MNIIPAIDLRNNNVVRLFQGDFNQQTTYTKSPLEVAKSYEQQGVTHLHIVDLDAAKNPDEQSQKDLIINIAQNTSLSVQTGGGIRDEQTLEKLFNGGIKKAIIGSLAVIDTQKVKYWIEKFGDDKFIIALDVKFNKFWQVAISGWQENTQIDINDVINNYSKFENLEFLITDISKDGSLQGPNFDLYRYILEKQNIKIQASGGVCQLSDLIELKEIGCFGSIIGKALLDNKFNIKEAEMINNLKFNESTGLIPAIIQNDKTMEVLMLGYMNIEAIEKTITTQKVHFFSRSRQRLWLKGETSGNFLNLVNIGYDCDKDALLVRVNPVGATCHLGNISCFNDNYSNKNKWLFELEDVIKTRKKLSPEESYVARLFAKGGHKIAQKVGEEAVETVIESIAGNSSLLKEECADLIFHFLILLNYNNLSISDIIEVLEKRNKK